MMNEWDKQIEALKRKYEMQKQLKQNKKRYGRCSCGNGRFQLKIINRQLIRICYQCNEEKEV